MRCLTPILRPKPHLTYLNPLLNVNPGPPKPFLFENLVTPPLEIFKLSSLFSNSNKAHISAAEFDNQKVSYK